MTKTMKVAATLLVLIQAFQGQAFRVGSMAHGRNQIISSTPGLNTWTQPFPSKRLHPTQLHATSSSSDDAEASSAASPSKSELILEEFHQSNLPFRIVVIGNGAILETTSKLGPKTKSSISPKTGEKLMTFASEDASFEFHVKVEQVCMITFVATERTLPSGETKVMRVSRFLSEKGSPICSLILAESSPEAVDWFEGMVERHGQEAIM